MKRIIEPLSRFGASFTAREGNFLPMTVRGGALTGIDYVLPVASAQVKSAVLLAGALAQGTTRVREALPSRNHTEIALREFGGTIRVHEEGIEVEGGTPLFGRTFTVPGDLSSAAFLVAAAVGTPGSSLRLTRVGMNESRAGFVALLDEMGANVRIENKDMMGGEPVADIVVESSELSGMEIASSWIPNIIDEIPVLAVLATRTKNGLTIRDAAELRSKETDRIHAVAVNLKTLGATVQEFPDGLFVPGGQQLKGGEVDSFDDHRIAMAFAVAGLFASGPVRIHNASCVGISFRQFFEMLASVTA
jgi:3-phosphoshikimate 1-carboxyvinyltransferase